MSKAYKGHVSHERWLVSFADFMTLLFALFVVMFASSQQDSRKLHEVEFSIRSAFESMGIFPATSKEPNLSSVVTITPKAASMVTLGDDRESSPGAMEDLNKIKSRMEAMLAPQIRNGTVTVAIGRGGLVITLRDAGFFESGSAIPKPPSVPTLIAIGNAIAAAPYNVRIEGHTDDVPIHDSLYPSNWELSTARATVLTRLFIETDHINPVRLSAAGYAEYHPVASNLTEEGRGKNRRVDIIVLPTRQQAAMMQQIVGAEKDGPPPPPADEKQLQKFLSIAYQSGFPPPGHASTSPPQAQAAGHNPSAQNAK